MLYTRWYFLFSLMPPTIMYQSLSGDTFTKKHFFKYIYFRLNLEILCVCFLILKNRTFNMIILFY